MHTVDRRTLLTVPLIGAGALTGTAAAPRRAGAPSAGSPASPSPAGGGQEALLRRWAADTWHCLDTMTVASTGLISDNIGADLIGHSGHTSPTNIGGSLWSVLIARELGLLTPGHARRRIARNRRHARLRKKIRGTEQTPRLVIHRSSRHISAQIIDDTVGHTLCAASTLEAEVRGVEGDKKARGAKVGELIAKRAADKGITEVVFDRGGYIFHGRVKELAEGAREGGLKF